ncbi:hypothetical protein [Caulobacter segnis]|uniref:hypothetical protein n=1 Tax=Caulobacter segnis TaxID=88688 RepID=UPI001CBE8851|nr:hypothetical protein [Caulobacter segnis]UAL10410.1 hypothetical protein K8940_22030 [Caulobacter segnis]
MLGVLLFSLLAPAESGVLDAAGLRQAMETAAQTRDASSLTGRKFRIVRPFADQKVVKYKAFKQSARWSYDRDKRAMVTTIGLGQITDQNFDGYKAAGLEALPPLQSLYFDVDARSAPTKFRTETRDGYNLDVGSSTRAASFGLAIPFKDGGPSALPEGFSPLVIGQTRGTSAQASRWAAAMIVVYEGEITDLTKTGVFCGAYHGQVSSHEITGDTPMMIQDKQCFITARIDRVEVIRDGQVLADWRKPPKLGL